MARIAILLCFVLVSCVPVNYAQPDEDQTLLDLRATQAVLDAAIARRTERAEYATSTAQAYSAAQTQSAYHATATQSAMSTQAAQTMEARITEQSWQITQQAAFGQATATQQAINRQATAEQGAIQAQSTALAAQAVIAEKSAEREVIVNNTKAWLPYVVIASFLVVILILGIRFTNVEINRRRWIERDARGDAPLRDDGHTIYDPDRNPGAMVNVPIGLMWMIAQRLNLLPQALIVDQTTTARDQMLDLAHRGLPATGSPARQLPEGIQQALKAPLFTVYRQDQIPPGFDQDTAQVLDQDWNNDTAAWQ